MHLESITWIQESYQQFKDAILKYYPNATEDFAYCVQDLDMLIGKRQHLGINMTQELTMFHIQFMVRSLLWVA